MQPRWLPLLLLAASALPAASPVAPPYTVVLVSPPSQNPDLSIYPDVSTLSGLNLGQLLATTCSCQAKLGQVTFMRNWDGELTLSNVVGYKAPAFPPTVTGVWVGDPAEDANGRPVNAPSNYIEMGKPCFTEWALLAENGFFVLEVSRFTHNTRGVCAVTIPGSGD